MSGILLLILLVIWLGLVRFIAKAFTHNLPGSRRGLRYWLLMALLLPLPFLDELLGHVQLRYVCSGGRVFLIANAKGRTVELQRVADVKVPYMLLPTRRQLWRFNDTKTGETVLAWDVYHARGGVLARQVGLSGAECHPGGVVDYNTIFKQNEISHVDALLAK